MVDVDGVGYDVSVPLSTFYGLGEPGAPIALTAIPGVGKKTAERLVVELKDRLPRVPTTEPTGEPVSGSTDRDDLLSALINLGYHRALAEKAVDASLSRGAGGDFEQHLRQALREVAK